MAGLTLEDIAKKAGVSRSTVSRVVNDHPYVREDVRQRVLEVIRSTGYHPNAAARTLASQRSWMLGLVVPKNIISFFTDPYFPQFIQGTTQACSEYDYTLSLFLMGEEESEDIIFSRVSRRGYLDGILVQSGQFGEHLIKRLVTSSMPLVIIGRPFHTDGVSFIDVDNIDASCNAVNHLLRLGYERIGIISGPANSTVGIDRKEGYRLALASHGRSLQEDLIAEGDFSEGSGYHAMQQLLPAKPDAIFAASDIMAVGAMRAAREAGLEIPKDLAFVGFDDLPLAETHEPALTTVRQPVHKTGYKAVEILNELIENGIEPARRITMSTELIVRESCGSGLRSSTSGEQKNLE